MTNSSFIRHLRGKEGARGYRTRGQRACVHASTLNTARRESERARERESERESEREREREECVSVYASTSQV